jgi:archaellum biogenesis protein FlaJ (TadC family)
MASKKLDSIREMSTGDKVDSEYPFFLLYIRSLTSGSISRLLLLKIAAEKTVFKHISPFLGRILYLSSEWRYPQAKAVEFMSQRVPTKDFSKFLYKFSQSISSGEPLPPFIEREYNSYSAEYEARRSQSLDRLKTYSDAYLPLLSVTLFLCTTMLVSSIFYNPETMILLTIMAVVAISFMLFLLSWLLFQAARPDEIIIDQEFKSNKRKLIETITILCLIGAVGSLLIPISYFQHLILLGILLLVPGTLGKIYIGKIQKSEETFPAFLRFMGSNLKVDIPLKDVIKESLEVDFGTLNVYLSDLYHRLEMRVEPKLAWLSFETEIDSRLIQRVNVVMTDTLATGGDMNQSSKLLEEFYHTYTSLRRKRYTAASYHVGIVIPLYAVMAALFATLDGFFTSLTGFMGKISTMVDFMASPPLDFMRFFFMFALTIFSLNNVYSIYNIEGDSRFTLLFYLGLQLAIAGTVYILINGAVTGYLGSMAGVKI